MRVSIEIREVNFDQIQLALEQASMYTHIILKEEWQRLKYEVAAPDALLRDILAAREREIAEDLASFEPQESELSPLSTDVPTAAPKSRPAPLYLSSASPMYLKAMTSSGWRRDESHLCGYSGRT